jgi:hypothetical protein
MLSRIFTPSSVLLFLLLGAFTVLPVVGFLRFEYNQYGDLILQKKRELASEYSTLVHGLKERMQPYITRGQDKTSETFEQFKKEE